MGGRRRGDVQERDWSSRSHTDRTLSSVYPRSSSRGSDGVGSGLAGRSVGGEPGAVGGTLYPDRTVLRVDVSPPPARRGLTASCSSSPIVSFSSVSVLLVLRRSPLRAEPGGCVSLVVLETPLYQENAGQEIHLTYFRGKGGCCP